MILPLRGHLVRVDLAPTLGHGAVTRVLPHCSDRRIARVSAPMDDHPSGVRVPGGHVVPDRRGPLVSTFYSGIDANIDVAGRRWGDPPPNHGTHVESERVDRVTGTRRHLTCVDLHDVRSDDSGMSGARAWFRVGG